MISTPRFLLLLALIITSFTTPLFAEEEEPSSDSESTAIVTKLKGTANAQETPQSDKVALKKDQQIAQKGTLSTETKSLLEVEFENKSMIRLGANSLFSFDRASREYNVRKGKFLLQVFGEDEDSKVITASFSAGITGTTVVTETDPTGKKSKIYVLETEDENGVEVTSNRTGEKVFLKPGQSLSVVADTLQKLNIINFNVQDFWQVNELRDLGNLHNNVEQVFNMIQNPESLINNPKDQVEEKINEVKDIRNLPGRLLPFGR